MTYGSIKIIIINHIYNITIIKMVTSNKTSCNGLDSFVLSEWAATCVPKTTKQITECKLLQSLTFTHQ